MGNTTSKYLTVDLWLIHSSKFQSKKENMPEVKAFVYLYLVDGFNLGKIWECINSHLSTGGVFLL